MSEDEPTCEEVNQYEMALDEIERLRARIVQLEEKVKVLELYRDAFFSQEEKIKELSSISVSMPEFTQPSLVDTIFLGTFFFSNRQLGSVKVKRNGSLFVTSALPFPVASGTRLEISFIDGPVIANVILPKAAWEKDVYTIDLSLST